MIQPLRRGPYVAEVPASKSIANRALLIAAFREGDTYLHLGKFGRDTQVLFDCLTAVGVRMEKAADGFLIHGCHAKPQSGVSLDVGSAGTVARFLTVILAFCGGKYEFRASEQMARRPMEHLALLADAGVSIGKGESSFPFTMCSRGIRPSEWTVDTDVSTQYASGILMASALTAPLTLRLTGSRTESSYLKMTLRLLKDFGADYERDGDRITVCPLPAGDMEYFVEPDVSAACYFYALSLLLSERVTVKGVHFGNSQGDMKFLELLRDKGVLLTDTPSGILADGTALSAFSGFDADMRDFSDQTLTVAALAPFATSPTRIVGVGHIRRQECDRLEAIRENLTRLGVPCRITQDALSVTPAHVHDATIATYGDHRVAMAFALTGLRGAHVTIDDPACCEKTFSDYFSVLSSLAK